MEIDNKEPVMAVLNGLYDSYQHLIVIMDALGDDSNGFTCKVSKSRHLQKERRLEMKRSPAQETLDSALG